MISRDEFLAHLALRVAMRGDVTQRIDEAEEQVKAMMKAGTFRGFGPLVRVITPVFGAEPKSEWRTLGHGKEDIQT